MVLIIGGAFQGKREYALGRFGQAEVWNCAPEDTRQPRGAVIVGLEQWLWALIQAGEDVEQTLEQVLPLWADSAVLCEDITGGVVPMDKQERLWREVTGRAMTRLAGEADEVVRLFCGLPTKLK
ncbi:bifunctional adenosylcobinamide kinase/adenosylcobinamide-phosphate guanylyltransferase [Oscillospiraceae bacterium MB08-C2-2]|nr:bifunctional adenosylcobinamide kinase/adenosylcobinamide-phosphate guanylyltransferase [Oscillospiraceae bacterium MB08-C2-2]